MLSWVHEKDLEDHDDLYIIDSFDSEADIATLLETYLEVIKEVDYHEIQTVRGTIDGYYVFVVGDCNVGFDLFDFIEKKNKSGVRFSCCVAGLKFPPRLSRGVYLSNSLFEEDEEDEEPATGYIDEDDMDEEEFTLIYLKTRQRVTIPETGLILGRSSKKATFVIHDNIKVGRVHCSLFFKNGILMVHDYDSLNGTFVNGERISSDTVVSKGDIIKLADEEFTVA